MWWVWEVEPFRRCSGHEGGTRENGILCCYEMDPIEFYSPCHHVRTQDVSNPEEGPNPNTTTLAHWSQTPRLQNCEKCSHIILNPLWGAMHSKALRANRETWIAFLLRSSAVWLQRRHSRSDSQPPYNDKADLCSLSRSKNSSLFMKYHTCALFNGTGDYMLI